MEINYHYYAFISYSTTDSKWAKWLQLKLSYYPIPTSIKKSKIDVPSKIKPVFIYEYDLAGNQLHKAIQRELEASKYLIVICSPNAAKSKYVNGEVETFKKMGRSEYIIPFIVDGEVNSSDSNRECFPSALLDLLHSGDKNNELRGANVMTKGRRQALVDVVATMLNVRRDVLWDRYKMRRLKQCIMKAAAVILMLLCGLFYWDYTRPTYRYFADYVDRWGVPEGIIELEPDIYEHRARSYRFEYRRIPFWRNYDTIEWKLSRVEYVNSAGQLQDHADPEQNNRFAIQKLEYEHSTGAIKNIDYCNKYGKTLLRWKVSNKGHERASIIDFLGGDGYGCFWLSYDVFCRIPF